MMFDKEKFEKVAEAMTNTSDDGIAYTMLEGVARYLDDAAAYEFVVAMVGAIRRSEQIRLRRCA